MLMVASTIHAIQLAHLLSWAQRAMPWLIKHGASWLQLFLLIHVYCYVRRFLHRCIRALQHVAGSRKIRRGFRVADAVLQWARGATSRVPHTRTQRPSERAKGDEGQGQEQPARESQEQERRQGRQQDQPECESESECEDRLEERSDVARSIMRDPLTATLAALEGLAR